VGNEHTDRKLCIHDAERGELLGDAGNADDNGGGERHGDRAGHDLDGPLLADGDELDGGSQPRVHLREREDDEPDHGGTYDYGGHDVRRAVHTELESETKMGLWERVIEHPKTSLAGVLLAVTTVLGVLQQQGISLGHAGTGTVVSLASALATAMLGLLAKD